MQEDEVYHIACAAVAGRAPRSLLAVVTGVCLLALELQRISAESSRCLQSAYLRLREDAPNIFDLRYGLTVTRKLWHVDCAVCQVKDFGCHTLPPLEAFLGHSQGPFGFRQTDRQTQPLIVPPRMYALSHTRTDRQYCGLTEIHPASMRNLKFE